MPKTQIPDPHNVELWCEVNGEPRQRQSTKDMIFSVPYLISYISQYFTLEPNDMILTGTPAGVGPVSAGDVIKGGITGLTQFTFNVESRS